jgi:CubicO group peptidase (beta-lactamase class C family)
MQRHTIVLALALSLQSSACDIDHDSTLESESNPRATFPGGDWAVEEPEDHALSSGGLANVATIAEQHKSTCLVVARDGVILGEWYWDGFDENTAIPNVWSVTKSVISAAIGIAQHEGLLDIHDRASDYIPQWQGTASEDVTIFDLLTHSSGREFDFFADLGILQAVDQTEYSLGFSQSLPPGTRFDYSNTGTQALEAVLEQAVGGDVQGYVEAKLFAPIGMSASLGHDPNGNVQTYTGLSATCRDLARFGHLYLRKGKWDGQQVVPKAWVAESTEPGTALNDAYGYLWWLNDDGHVVLSSIPERAEYEGKVLPSAPDSMVMALGAFGQFIAYDRESGLVIVRTTLDYDMSDPLSLGDMDAILGAVEAAKLE